MLLLDLSKIRQLALHSFSSLISLFHYHFKVKVAAFTLFRIHSNPFKDQWLDSWKRRKSLVECGGGKQGELWAIWVLYIAYRQSTFCRFSL